MTLKARKMAKQKQEITKTIEIVSAYSLRFGPVLYILNFLIAYGVF